MPRRRLENVVVALLIPQRRTSKLCGLLCLLVASTVIAEEPTLPNSSWRAYRTGRITNDDYRMQAPPRRAGDPDARLDANMFTGLYFFTDYVFDVRSQKVKLKLKGIRFVGYVDQSRSWRRRDLDDALLDHEQGHFDINEIYVRRASALIHDRLRRPGGVQVVAPTRKQAEAALNERISELIEPVVYDLRKAHASYDQKTVHGTIQDRQKEARKTQLDELKSSQPASRRRGNAASEPASGR